MKTEDNVQLEVYRTPPWVYELLYAKYPLHFIGVGFDPSAGDGRMLAALNNKSGVLCDIRKSERRKRGKSIHVCGAFCIFLVIFWPYAKKICQNQ